MGLYAGYRTAIPLDVMRLDVLLRQVQLEAKASNEPQARVAFNEVQGVWSRLSSRLSATPAVESFQRELQLIHRTTAQGSTSATARAAARALEGVDDLEKLFAVGH